MSLILFVLSFKLIYRIVTFSLEYYRLENPCLSLIPSWHSLVVFTFSAWCGTRQNLMSALQSVELIVYVQNVVYSRSKTVDGRVCLSVNNRRPIDKCTAYTIHNPFVHAIVKCPVWLGTFMLCNRWNEIHYNLLVFYHVWFAYAMHVSREMCSLAGLTSDKVIGLRIEAAGVWVSQNMWL